MLYVPPRTALVLCLLALAGCPRAADAPPKPAALPFAGQSLKLIVVDDEPLAHAAEGLAAEWKTRTGASFSVDQRGSKELLSSKSLQADAVIYPAGMLGTLSERGWLAAVPESVLAGEQLGWKDVFPLARGRIVSWGDDVEAVPFGVPVLTCYYRADLFEKTGKKPPDTWAEYQELAAFFQSRESLGDAAPAPGSAWSGAAEPLAPGWAGLMLLARAAAYVSHPYYHSLLFDLETMQPRIDQTPYVRALDELAAAHGTGPTDARFGPAEVRQAFWEGRCALALAWPTRSGGTPAKGAANKLRAGFAAIPGAREVYNWGENSWENRHKKQVVRIPLLDVAGRLGSVNKRSTHAEAAFQLLASLSGEEFGRQVCVASAETTLVRPVPRKELPAWLDPAADAEAAKQYSVVLQESLAGEQYLCGPRIPGRADYLAALDEAVEKVLAKTATSSEALGQCAEKWRRITERYGVGAQRKAYERCLGNAP